MIYLENMKPRPSSFIQRKPWREIEEKGEVEEGEEREEVEGREGRGEGGREGGDVWR
jgi:hypothetical protein